jgi:hypothetical protein
MPQRVRPTRTATRVTGALLKLRAVLEQRAEGRVCLTTARVRDEDLPVRAVARPLDETEGREEHSGARAKKTGSVVVPTGARVDATHAT